MWSNIKKLILFLFGIVLVVFGNRAAINTIFGSGEKEKEDNQAIAEPEAKEAVIDEEVKTETTVDNVEKPDKPEVVEVVPTQAPAVAKTVEKKVASEEKQTKTETMPSAMKQPAKVEKAAVQPVKAQEEKKEKVAEEINKTTIEPEESEEATGTE